jgi:hypothetical protein
MVDATKLYLHCGGSEDATYLMTTQEYDEHRKAPASMRIYWCGMCREESRYPDTEDTEED